jgi:hypothetical protein
VARRSLRGSPESSEGGCLSDARLAQRGRRRGPGGRLTPRAWRSSRASRSRTGSSRDRQVLKPNPFIAVAAPRVRWARQESACRALVASPPAPTGSRDVPSRETSPQATRQAVAFGGWRHLGAEVGRDPFATECALLDPSNSRPGAPMPTPPGGRRTPELSASWLGSPRR